jgi:hypothetical protein
MRYQKPVVMDLNARARRATGQRPLVCIDGGRRPARRLARRELAPAGPACRGVAPGLTGRVSGERIPMPVRAIALAGPASVR